VPGRLGADRRRKSWLRSQRPCTKLAETSFSGASTELAKKRIVIVGAGFGGLATAKALARADIDITIVDKRNYHLFQPLLYQVAAAGLSPADIAWPIRNIFSRQSNVSVRLARVTNIDARLCEVTDSGGRLAYDYLVIASGAQHAYFGHDEWEPLAPGLKRLVDATEIRKRVLLAFERAEACADAAEQRRQLTFVIVGGGPTGVELAGAIAELARHTLARDFRFIDPKSAHIILVEASDRVLSALPPSLSSYSLAALERLGVDVRLGQPVGDVTQAGVTIGASFVPTATAIWCAGVAVPDVGGWLGAETDRVGRVVIGPDLSVPEYPNVFVIGDAAHVRWRDEDIVPGIAPAAKQQGRYVGKVIAAQLKGARAPGPFKYSHSGNLATIGRNAAVVDLNGVTLKGSLAWWFWGLAHIYFLIGVRSPTLVSLQWLWSYLTYRKGARLITGAGQLLRGEDESPM
jgi:NADH:quinone reductase (non-electrogenic)